jgi:hypothetical protein
MENSPVDIREKTSEELGLLLIEQFSQLSQVQNNVQAIRNLLMERQSKSPIIAPLENQNASQ